MSEPKRIGCLRTGSHQPTREVRLFVVAVLTAGMLLVFMQSLVDDYQPSGARVLNQRAHWNISFSNALYFACCTCQTSGSEGPQRVAGIRS
jgi:hypothetical protein